MDDIGINNSPIFLVGMLIGFAISILLFLIGFLPGFYLSRRILSGKKGKRIIKAQKTRLLISVGTGLICGYASYVILYPVLLRLSPQ